MSTQLYGTRPMDISGPAGRPDNQDALDAPRRLAFPRRPRSKTQWHDERPNEQSAAPLAAHGSWTETHLSRECRLQQKRRASTQTTAFAATMVGARCPSFLMREPNAQTAETVLLSDNETAHTVRATFKR